MKDRVVGMVHGEFPARTKQGDIPCNAYCKDGLHCDIVWSIDNEKIVHDALQSLYAKAGVWLERIELAREAGPAPDLNRMFILEGTMEGKAATPWLTFWRVVPVDIVIIL